MIDALQKWGSLIFRDLPGREAELIDDLYHAKQQLNLHVPATRDNVARFFNEFLCQRCGHCCEVQVSEGIILVPGDAQQIAGYLQITAKEFKKQYTFTTAKGRFIKTPCPCYEKSDDGLSSCRIHPVRPQVCRMWPVNTPVASGMLHMNTDCPAGRITGRKILERSVKVAYQVA